MSRYDYRYHKKWRLDRERGIKRLVDPAPVREHIQMLLDLGATRRGIGEASGTSATQVCNLMKGDSRTVISRRVAAKILAVRPERLHIRAAGDGFVPRVGVVRRIQALQRVGHTAATIGAAAGTSDKVIHNLINQAGPYVSAANRDAVLRAYAALWDQPGLSKHVRDRAAKKDWAPPLAWDDDTIDDPAATPDLGEDRTTNRGRAAEDLVEDVQDLLTFEPLATAQQLADRLGYRDRSGIQLALKRAGRQDLLAQLARNADLAHPGQANRKDTAA